VVRTKTFNLSPAQIDEVCNVLTKVKE